MKATRREAGFTLIEIMAAIAILAIAMTAVFATLTSQQRSFTAQNRVAEMQQNLRLAADILVRDIRMAGYGLPLTTGTSSDNVAIPASATPAGFTTMRAMVPIDNNNGPDQLYIMYLYDMDSNQPPAALTANMAATTGATVDNTLGFRTAGGELVLVTDRVTADLFETTSGGTGTTLKFDAAGSPYNVSHAKLYEIGTMPGSPPTVAAKARFVRYFIQNVTHPDGTTHPTLMLQWLTSGGAAQPVADDIEDMQLSYGVDTNADGVVDAFRNRAGGAALAASDIPRIRQVRLTLIARSRMEETGWAGRRPPAENNPQGPVDGFRRRNIVVDIDLRNSGT